MCYLPAAALAGIWLANNESIKQWQKGALLVISLLWSAAMIGLNFIAIHKKESINQLHNPLDEFFTNQLRSFDGVGWNAFGYIIGLSFLTLTVYLIFKYKKPKLVTYLTFNVLIISGMLYYFTPLVERFTQKQWIEQLESYQGKEMMHFTVGFKSYAHIYYTQQVTTDEFAEVKRKVLEENGALTFLDLNRQQKGEYDYFLMDYVLNETEIPLSITTKEVEKFKDHQLLEQVFFGNGYYVYERK
jgi:hypothetical protein